MRSTFARRGLTLMFALLAAATTPRPLTAATVGDPGACCRGSRGGGHGGSHAGGGHRGYGGGVSHGRSPRAPRARSGISAPRVRSHAPRTHASPKPRVPRSTRAYAPGTRDSRGRLKRSAAAKDDFMRESGHPHGWPGHVVDHIVPLACGGADAPSNMQWQTTAEAKAKDRTERIGCGRSR